MRLVERGFIFKPTGEYEWSRSHAQVPFAFVLKDKVRVFFSTRDSQSQSSVSFVDVDLDNPKKIIYTHNKPVFQRGKPGTFDDSGTMPSWFIQQGDAILMYYTAWNRSETASYRLSIGLARSQDNGLTFERMFEGPIIDRGKFDPIWVGQPCVIKFHENDWRMWYLSCQKIEVINNIPEPFYNVKYATSKNGIDWHREEKVCIDFDDRTDAIGRPCVWIEHGIFKMLHSNRKANGYRSLADSAYRIEYSESNDGIHWERKPQVLSFIKSGEGWDGIMNEYCTVYNQKDFTYLLYNGDGFGKSGFGFAKLDRS